MELILKGKKYWNLIPLLSIFLIVGTVFFKAFTVDIIYYKREEAFSYNMFLGAVLCLPLFLLSLFDHWKKQLFPKKILLVALSFLLIAMNFRLQQAFQASVVFALSVIIYFVFEKKIYRPSLFYVLLFLYFVLDAVSLLWSSNVGLGIGYLMKLSPLAFIPILFCFFKLSRKDFDMIALFLFRFSMIFAVISVCSWIIESRFLNFPLVNSLLGKKYFIASNYCYDVIYAWSNKVHPTYNAILLLFSLSIGWYYIFKKNVEDNIGWLEFSFIVFITFFLAVITVSRFMLVLWVIINVAGVIFSLRHNKKVLTVVSSVIIVAGISIIALFSEKFLSFINDPIRVCHYEAAFQSIEENTWIGTGLGGMTKYINRDNPAYVPLHLSSAVKFNHIHPHNQFVGDLMQTGVLGLILILFIMGFLFYSSIKHRNWLLMINSFMFLCLMNIEMPLMYINGIFTFALIFSLLTKIKPEDTIMFDFKNRQKGI